MPLAWGLLALVGLLVVLTWGALQIQLALAALLNGESTWSKAQKQLVIDIDSFAASGEVENLARFERNFALLEFDRFAREETAKEHFDYDKVTAALRHDNAIKEAIPVVIFMLHRLPDAPYMRDALSAWRATDAPIAELKQIAAELAQARSSGSLSSKEVIRQRARVAALNAYIQPNSDLFSTSMANGTSWLGRVMFVSVLLAACIASILWFAMARRILAGIRGSEERYRLLFDSAADAIVMVDEDTGAILDANRTASAWIGRSPGELVGERFADLFADDTSQQALVSAIGALRREDGSERPVETQSSLAKWGKSFVRQAIMRDISDRVVMEQERRIAAEALASVAEGVIIADGNRSVIAVNAAHTQITGFTAETICTLRLDDTRTMPDGEPLPESVWETIAREGNWLGEVKSRRRDGSTYTEQLSISAIRDSGGRVQHYVAVFTDITLTKANTLRLEHMATHDTLTGLINRAQFEKRCTQAIAAAGRANATMAVLFIDLDAFKIVNDSFNHSIGDRLLVQVAERILQQLTDVDIAGRIGGDEFTVLVRKLGTREDAGALASRLLLALSEPHIIDDHEIVVSASIGIAGYPIDGRDPITLIANADAAMYAAKTKERNSHRFYSPMMHADIRKRLHLAGELRQALARDEFHIVYQPSIELRSGRIIAVEALVRWHHPERGDVPPADFIPVAESLGLVRHIDQWVMRNAFAQMALWEKAGMPPIRVALNVSANWFGHSAFVEFLTHSVQSMHLNPALILLEITEGSILRMGEDTDRTMLALHDLGVAVAIDDFGTGYSSLAYLKLPAVAYLKIDRSFVEGLPHSANDAAIVQAMLAISKSLGLCTIAEGIETEAQHDFLLRGGCMEAQGFLYSQPLSAEEISRLLSPNPKRVKTRLQLVEPSRG